MHTDKHFMWHMAGAVYTSSTLRFLSSNYGNGWVYKWYYYEGDGGAYLHVESRILDTEVYMYGYRY